MDELAQLWQGDAQHDLKTATSAIAQRQLPAVALRDIARNAQSEARTPGGTIT